MCCYVVVVVVVLQWILGDGFQPPLFRSFARGRHQSSSRLLRPTSKRKRRTSPSSSSRKTNASKDKGSHPWFLSSCCSQRSSLEARPFAVRESFAFWPLNRLKMDSTESDSLHLSSYSSSSSSSQEIRQWRQMIVVTLSVVWLYIGIFSFTHHLLCLAHTLFVLTFSDSRVVLLEP